MEVDVRMPRWLTKKEMLSELPEGDVVLHNGTSINHCIHKLCEVAEVLSAEVTGFYVVDFNKLPVADKSGKEVVYLCVNIGETNKCFLVLYQKTLLLIKHYGRLIFNKDSDMMFNELPSISRFDLTMLYGNVHYSNFMFYGCSKALYIGLPAEFVYELMYQQCMFSDVNPDCQIELKSHVTGKGVCDVLSDCNFNIKQFRYNFSDKEFVVEEVGSLTSSDDFKDFDFAELNDDISTEVEVEQVAEYNDVEDTNTSNTEEDSVSEYSEAVEISSIDVEEVEEVTSELYEEQESENDSIAEEFESALVDKEVIEASADEQEVTTFIENETVENVCDEESDTVQVYEAVSIKTVQTQVVEEAIHSLEDVEEVSSMREDVEEVSSIQEVEESSSIQEAVGESSSIQEGIKEDSSTNEVIEEVAATDVRICNNDRFEYYMNTGTITVQLNGFREQSEEELLSNVKSAMTDRSMMLIDGQSFRKAISIVFNHEEETELHHVVTTGFIKNNDVASRAVNVAVNSSVYIVYMYRDGNTLCIATGSNKVALNPNSADMFSKLPNLVSLNLGSIDFTRVETFARFAMKDIRLRYFKLNAIALNGLKTAQDMFTGANNHLLVDCTPERLRVLQSKMISGGEQ